MKKPLSLLASAAALTILAACGGGGGGGDSTAAGAGAGTTGAASKYVGTWTGCSSNGPATSRRETLVFTQQAADTFAFNFTEVDHAAPACTGAAGSTTTGTGTVALSGTKTIGADTVDKGIVTEAGRAAEKQVFLLKGAGLSFGRPAGDGGTVDAEGYPNTLENASLSQTNPAAPAPAPATNPVTPAPAPATNPVTPAPPGGTPPAAPAPAGGTPPAPPATQAPPAAALVCTGSYSLTVNLSAYGCSNNWTFNGSFTEVGIDFEKTGPFSAGVTLTNISREFQGAPGSCTPVDPRAADGVFNGSMNLSRIGGGTLVLLGETTSLQFSVGSLNTVLGTIAGSDMTGSFSCTY